MNRLSMHRAISLFACLLLAGCGGARLMLFEESRLEAAPTEAAPTEAAPTEAAPTEAAATEAAVAKEGRRGAGSAAGDVTYVGEFEEVVAAFNADDLAQAKKLLTEVTTREPDHAKAWANLGMVLSRSASDDEAIAALEQAVSINPQLAPALNQLGVLYRRTGRLADAERAYTEALTADPDNARTHRNIGVLYDVYLGRPADALRHYQRSMELEPDGEPLAGWVVELERRVQVLEASNR